MKPGGLLGIELDAAASPPRPPRPQHQHAVVTQVEELLGPGLVDLPLVLHLLHPASDLGLALIVGAFEHGR